MEIILNNIIPGLNLTTKNMFYRDFNSIIQSINFLRDIDYFCIKYKVNEGCTLCTAPFAKMEFLHPAFQIKLKDFLNNLSLTEIKKER